MIPEYLMKKVSYERTINVILYPFNAAIQKGAKHLMFKHKHLNSPLNIRKHERKLTDGFHVPGGHFCQFLSWEPAGQ